MDKKIVVLIRAGVPYKNTISYGRQRAREAGAKLLLVGVIPAMTSSHMVALATCEIGPYETIVKKFEKEAYEYLERAVQFCLDNSLTVESTVQSGGVGGVAKMYSRDTNVKLVVVPTPIKQEHHSEFLDTLKHFTHNILDHELRCPVVTVLAT